MARVIYYVDELLNLLFQAFGKLQLFDARYAGIAILSAIQHCNGQHLIKS